MCSMCKRYCLYPSYLSNRNLLPILIFKKSDTLKGLVADETDERASYNMILSINSGTIAY